MSCSDTAVNQAVTTAAKAAEPTLTRTQVSSLFHGLKREGRDKDIPTPTREEYLEGIAVLMFRAQADDRLDAAARARMLAKLDEATRDPRTPNGPTWHAIREIQSHARVTAERIEQRLQHVARDMEIRKEHLDELFEAWRDNPDQYLDTPAPDPKFRYDTDPTMPTDERTQKALRKLGYEHYLDQPLPVFVYGTLRRGQGNHVLLEGAVDYHAPGKLHGVAIYKSRYGFPYATEHEDPDAVTIGEVMWISKGEPGWHARANLDHLEGFDSNNTGTSHYERVARNVTVSGPDGSEATVKAWVYLARGNSRAALQEHDRIHAGDWVAAGTPRSVHF